MQKTKITIETASIVKFFAFAVVTYVLINVVIILKAPIIWVLIALFLAIGIEPVIQYTKKYLRGSRSWALTVVLALTLVLLTVIVMRLVPPLIDQTQQLFAALPELQEEAEKAQTPLAQFVADANVLSTVEANKDKIVTFITQSFGAIFLGSINVIGATITIISVLAFAVANGPNWMNTLKQSSYGGFYRKWEDVILQMRDTVSIYVTGNLTISFLAFLTALAMMILLGLPYALPIAFLYGIFDLIPLIGATLGGILLVGIALFKSLTAALIMLAYVLIYQQVESSILSPKIYGKALRLPNAMVFLAALVGGTLAGLIGALLAIPVAACIRIGLLAYAQEKGRG